MKKFIHRDDIGDFECPTIKVIDGKRFYVTPDDNAYPSITSILALQDKPGLKKWREDVGEKEAKRISKESMRIGTAVHQMAEFYLSNYDFPVFPEDFAYYLMKDDKTLIMVSAVKNINQNFKFDISTRKLHKYSTKGKLNFIISSVTKNCGFSTMNETYKCNYYKPLISQNLIN